MFEILGFILVGVLIFKMSLLGLLLAVNNLGEYNIGGVPNGVIKKILTVVFIVAVALSWYFLFKNAPFTINFNWKD